MKFPEVKASQLRTFNLWATFVWMLLIVPTLVWWKESILWVAMMSIWANIVGHFSAWVAARAEEMSENNPPQDAKTKSG